MKLFRVYDKASHKWITDDVVIDSGGGATLIEVNGIEAILVDHYLPDEITIELFTGVYDSQGNQIFEGDILNWNDKVTGEVRYDASYSGYYLVTEGHNKFYDPYKRVLLGFNADECTVIGNIHGLEMEE